MKNNLILSFSLLFVTSTITGSCKLTVEQFDREIASNNNLKSTAHTYRQLSKEAQEVMGRPELDENKRNQLYCKTLVQTFESTLEKHPFDQDFNTFHFSLSNLQRNLSLCNLVSSIGKNYSSGAYNPYIKIQAHNARAAKIKQFEIDLQS